MERNFVRAIVVDPTSAEEVPVHLRTNHMLVVLKRMGSSSYPEIIEPDSIGPAGSVSDGRVRFFTGDTPAYFLSKLSSYFDLMKMARDRAVVLSLLTGLHFYSVVNFAGISGTKEGDFHILLPGDFMEITVNITKPDSSTPSFFSLSTVFDTFKVEVMDTGGTFSEIEQESVVPVSGSTLDIKITNNASTVKVLYGICVVFE